jgi:hypothetical protein
MHIVNDIRTSRGNRLAALYLEQPDARFTIVFSHGNAVGQRGWVAPGGQPIHSWQTHPALTPSLHPPTPQCQVDIGIMAIFMAILCPTLNCSFFAYDYSGYGCSSGKPSEKNLYADITAAVACAHERCVIVHGRGPWIDGS